MNKLVPLNELFTPVYGVNLELVNIEECKKSDYNSIRFISRTEINNGVSAYVKRMNEIAPNPAHTISVAVSGSVLSSFYQDKEYYSGRDLYYLLPQKKMSKEEMIFYALCIKANKYKYNYGRAANKTLKDILLPIEMPDDFKKITFSKISVPSEKSVLEKQFDLNTKNWEPFKLITVFEITLGKPIHSKEFDETNKSRKGKNIPYVTRTTFNNGIEFFVPIDIQLENKKNLGNCLTIGAEGFKAFFQPIAFVNGNKVNIIRHKKLNKYNALFLRTILNLEIQDKFNYGRGLTKVRLEDLVVKLPVLNNDFDWGFMENFIKSLPYSSSI